MSAFDQIKDFFIAGTYDWHDKKYRVGWGSTVPVAMIGTLTLLSPYLLIAYDVLFMENERGLARVAVISDTAVRLEYIAGPAKGTDEWVQAVDFAGNADGSRRTFIQQPLDYLYDKRRQPTS